MGGTGAYKLLDLEEDEDDRPPDSDLTLNGIINDTVRLLSTEKEKLTASIEDCYSGVDVPQWLDQITLRGLVVSFVLGALFCIIVHKLDLTTGFFPPFNVAAGLLSFFFLKMWTLGSTKLGFFTKPFTRQENTVVQTCVIACSGIAFSGGFGSYLLGMDQRSHDVVGGFISTNRHADIPGNEDVKNPGLMWMTGYMLVVSFVGIFSIVALRKIMIIDYKLTYPSGTATGILINSFHSPCGAVVANKQVKRLAQYFTMSFFWSFFKWFFSGIGNSCGFDHFPSLGLQAYHNNLFFDFNMTYIGAGMICPHNINVSMVVGAIVSWGLIWPLIQGYEGDWFPSGLGPSDFKGLYAYKVFVMISIIVGDGLYNFMKIVFISGCLLADHYQTREELPVATPELEDVTEEDAKQQGVFIKEEIPMWVAGAGYMGLALVATIIVPKIFVPVKWYYVLICYILAPIFAFSNAYGMGLTNWSLASSYGKLVLFLFGAWAGTHGGVLVGLALCGVMLSVVVTAADLMQDFRTGYLTLTSPRSMFVSQLIGVLMGCFLAPATFWIFYKAFDIGNPEGEYKAPYAVVYRSMALIGVEGFGALPAHCLQLCFIAFAVSVAINLVRDSVPSHVAKYIPIPMVMAVPFYLGGYFTLDMFVGTVIRFVYERINQRKSDIMVPAVAAGLICGDGVWTIPAAFLSLAKVDPPMCMYFFASRSSEIPKTGYRNISVM